MKQSFVFDKTSRKISTKNTNNNNNNSNNTDNNYVLAAVFSGKRWNGAIASI